jgi:hypothetical protein
MSPDPSDFVLASSTIPVYFKPFVHELPQAILDLGAAPRLWNSELLFSGRLPQSVVFADGAILSNLPFHLFTSSPRSPLANNPAPLAMGRERDTPQLAKIGVSVAVGRERDAPLKIDSLQTLIEALSSTTRLLNDRSYQHDNPMYKDCIVVGV